MKPQNRDSKSSDNKNSVPFWDKLLSYIKRDKLIPWLIEVLVFFDVLWKKFKIQIKTFFIMVVFFVYFLKIKIVFFPFFLLVSPKANINNFTVWKP